MAPEHSSEDDGPRGDPWHAFGYMVSGVGVYGLIGFGLDRWLGTEFLVAIGICVGAGLGLYMTWARFNKTLAPRQPGPPEQPPEPPGEQQGPHDPHDDRR